MASARGLTCLTKQVSSCVHPTVGTEGMIPGLHPGQWKTRVFMTCFMKQRNPTRALTLVTCAVEQVSKTLHPAPASPETVPLQDPKGPCWLLGVPCTAPETFTRIQPFVATEQQLASSQQGKARKCTRPAEKKQERHKEQRPAAPKGACASVTSPETTSLGLGWS